MLVFLLISTASCLAHAQELCKKIEFAEHLAKSHRPTHALIEFERLIFFSESCERNLEIVESALHLFKAGYLQDKSKINLLIQDIQKKCHDDKVHKVQAEFVSFVGEKMSDQDETTKTKVVSKPLAQKKSKDLIRIRMQNLYEKNLINDNTIKDDKYLRKAKQLESQYKRYNPTTAKLLEAFIPGGGHFYLQNYNDAITSMTLKTILIGSSVMFFQDGNYFAGAGAGLGGGIFYAGSVSSAGKNAQELNDLHSDAFATSFVDRIDDKDYKHVLPIFNFQIDF